jgi:hypothetical protein
MQWGFSVWMTVVGHIVCPGTGWGQPLPSGKLCWHSWRRHLNMSLGKGLTPLRLTSGHLRFPSSQGMRPSQIALSGEWHPGTATLGCCRMASGPERDRREKNKLSKLNQLSVGEVYSAQCFCNACSAAMLVLAEASCF